MKKRKENNHINVLVHHNTLSPYRVALFRALAESEGYEFKFYFSSRNLDEHQWKFDDRLGFNYEILRTKKIDTGYGTLYFLKDVEMISKPYDLIVMSDHLNIPELTLQMYAKFKRIPILRWLASTKNSLEGMSKIKLKLKSLLNQSSDGVLVTGNKAKEYVVESTHRDDNVFICNNVVDNSLFTKARTVGPEKIKELKQRYKLEGTVISYFGQLIERKGLDILLNAIDSVKTDQPFSLLIVGEGPLKNEITNKLDEMDRCNYYFVGYADPEDLPLYYAISDFTVLPSLVDTWGMVVNESMAAGVPVICSTGAGASDDLIRDGVSGLIFEKGNSNELARAIERMISNPEQRSAMVKEADKILSDFTLEKANSQFLEAINKTYESVKNKRKLKAVVREGVLNENN